MWNRTKLRLSRTTSRYFSLDFDSQEFYYRASPSAHSVRKMNIKFPDILSADRQGDPLGTSWGAEFQFGFVVSTCHRTFELFASDPMELIQWVVGLQAAMRIG